MSMNIENQICEPRTNHGETVVEQRGNNEQIVGQIQTGEKEQENMTLLWQQNQNFIAMIARKYSSCAEMEDLEQEGYIGLYEAVRHYDASSGVPFINYAAFWIRQVMRRYIDNCGRVVRIPTHAVDKMQRYKKIKSEYQKYYGKIPTDREMSAFMGTDEESLKSIKKAAAMGQIRSLDEPINSDEEDIYIGDTIASKEDVEADVIDRIDSDIMSRELWAAVDRLPDLQGKVLRCRFLEKKTYQQTGEKLGISVSAVRQQQSKAMSLLRNRGRNKGFIGYREEFLPAASIHHVGVRSFQHTWTSEVEREALSL